MYNFLKFHGVKVTLIATKVDIKEEKAEEKVEISAEDDLFFDAE